MPEIALQHIEHPRIERQPRAASSTTAARTRISRAAQYVRGQPVGVSASIGARACLRNRRESGSNNCSSSSQSPAESRNRSPEPLRSAFAGRCGDARDQRQAGRADPRRSGCRQRDPADQPVASGTTCNQTLSRPPSPCAAEDARHRRGRCRSAMSPYGHSARIPSGSAESSRCRRARTSFGRCERPVDRGAQDAHLLLIAAGLPDGVVELGGTIDLTLIEQPARKLHRRGGGGIALDPQLQQAPLPGQIIARAGKPHAQLDQLGRFSPLPLGRLDQPLGLRRDRRRRSPRE